MPAQAQTGALANPVYVVQAGETLWDIARRFGVSLNDLMQANDIVDAGIIKAGDELIIPGLYGITGRLITRPLAFGESLPGLSRLYGLPIETLAQLNRIVSPDELYVGLELILPENTQGETGNTQVGIQRITMSTGQSPLELTSVQVYQC